MYSEILLKRPPYRPTKSGLDSELVLIVSCLGSNIGPGANREPVYILSGLYS